MSNDLRKPRYQAPERRERQPRGRKKPLDLRPQHPAKGWAKTLLNVSLTTLVPTALLWWWTLTMSAYRVTFTTAVSDVRLDGKPVPLDFRKGFEIPRLPLGGHRLTYRDAQGHNVALALHPSPFDNDATPLIIDAGRTKGVPSAEFTTP